MILGIGNDLARIDRFTAGMARHGERFAQRLLGPSELARFHHHPQPAAFLAKRFAAKEAFLKALGTGLRHGMRWTEIEVVNDTLGRPSLSLAGRAREQAQAAGVVTLHLSLSDDDGLALAFVVLEG
ncbi:holo-ACP synthase [Halomonas salipaludis]|uniref:Holo-[acyl-carrier-protein] synthase n=1 Tax=Halomonas salipaludis TaxID=2032625 RepID=A0A2A2ETK1_9GAMM|nr:holo-ACP synthase [Halomonas salipaludis]PAU75745.1 holo-ACP synthase [Halomonas salipaludis]